MRQSRAFQRLGAATLAISTACYPRRPDLPLSKTPKGRILA